MTTEEKLKHFQEICMTDAREKSARMLDDCVRALDAAFEEHKAEAEGCHAGGGPEGKAGA